MTADQIIAILGTVIFSLSGVIVRMALHVQSLNASKAVEIADIKNESEKRIAVLNRRIADAEIARVRMAEDCGSEKDSLNERWRESDNNIRASCASEVKDLSVQLINIMVQTNKTLDGILSISTHGGEKHGR